VNQHVTFVDRGQDSSDDECDPDRPPKVVAPATDRDRMGDPSRGPAAPERRHAHGSATAALHALTSVDTFMLLRRDRDQPLAKVKQKIVELSRTMLAE